MVGSIRTSEALPPDSATPDSMTLAKNLYAS